MITFLIGVVVGVCAVGAVWLAADGMRAADQTLVDIGDDEPGGV